VDTRERTSTNRASEGGKPLAIQDPPAQSQSHSSRRQQDKGHTDEVRDSGTGNPVGDLVGNLLQTHVEHPKGRPYPGPERGSDVHALYQQENASQHNEEPEDFKAVFVPEGAPASA
jgi:hypothetical protein